MKCNGKLKSLRLKAGFSQSKLARKANLERTTISNAERGFEVSDLTMAKLSNALSSKLGKEIGVEELLDISDEQIDADFEASRAGSVLK